MRKPGSASFGSRFPLRRQRRGATLALLALAGFGCSVVTSYPSTVSSSLKSFVHGDPGKACEELQERTTSTLDSVAYLFEVGTCYHVIGEFKKSNEAFFRAKTEIKNQEEKARISASQIGSQVASLLVNEKTIPYEGESFEKVLVNAYLAMNFIMLGDLQGARVEIRQMDERLKAIEEKQEEDLERLRKEWNQPPPPQQQQQQRGGPPPPPPEPRATEADLMMATEPLFKDMGPVLARVPNALRLQDAFSRYLSSVVYQMNARGPGDTGEFNDAYIDMKKVYQSRPDAAFLGTDLLRLAKASRILDEYAKWKKTFPDAEEPRDGAGELLVLFENGSAPWKDQVSIPIPLSRKKGAFTTVAFPAYRQNNNPVARAVLTDAKGTARRTSALLTDIEGIAVKTLKDRMPVLVLKQALRAAAKGVASAQAGKEGGPWAGLGTSLFLAILEQADQRSWMTLPQNIQVIRVPLPPGTYQMKLMLEGWNQATTDAKEFSVTIRQGKTSVVNCRSAGPRFIGMRVTS